MKLDPARAEEFVFGAIELKRSAPKLKSGILNSIFFWFKKVCLNEQHERTSIAMQHHRAKMVRHHASFFRPIGTPEILASAEKCEGPCGNHVYMLVRSDKSLCFGCWGQSLKTLD
jgi:hypothetical protein